MATKQKARSSKLTHEYEESARAKTKDANINWVDVSEPGINWVALSVATVVGLLGASFALALKVAAPVLVAMLLATVAMGMLQKTMPQCNLLSTHLPIHTLVGLTVLAASLGVLLPLMQQAIDVLTNGIAAFAQASAAGG